MFKLFAGRGPISSQRSAILGSEDIHRWPEVLASLLSNPVTGDIDMIRQLGESLLANGDVCAAHCCFLCIESTGQERLVQLYGALAGDIPAPESIQRTEIAEYAASLGGGSAAAFTSFLPYKLTYATWLADSNQFQKALDYCDVIGRTLRDLPSATVRKCCSPSFLRRVMDLEERCRVRHGAPRPSSSELWRSLIPALYASLLVECGPSDVPSTAGNSTTAGVTTYSASHAAVAATTTTFIPTQVIYGFDLLGFMWFMFSASC